MLNTAAMEFKMPVMTSPSQLLTVGQIAERLGVRKSRIAYAIDSYRIEPAARAGILRVFNEADLPIIRGALRRVAERRGSR